MGLYLLSALSKDDAINESLILKERCDLLNEGVNREKLEVRKSELFNDEVKVEINSELDAKQVRKESEKFF